MTRAKGVLLTVLFFLLPFGAPPPSSAAPPPEYLQVSILAIVDGDLKEVVDEKILRYNVREIVKIAAKVFEEEFQIMLTLKGIDFWPIREEKEIDLHEAVLELENFLDNADADILVRFTDKTTFLCVRYKQSEADKHCYEKNYKKVGAVLIFGRAAIIRVWNLDSYTHQDGNALSLIHELGHIFGARHKNDPTSVMYESSLSTPKFDKENKMIIHENRNRKFR